jgi:hypothetical protein
VGVGIQPAGGIFVAVLVALGVGTKMTISSIVCVGTAMLISPSSMEGSCGVFAVGLSPWHPLRTMQAKMGMRRSVCVIPGDISIMRSFPIQIRLCFPYYAD